MQPKRLSYYLIPLLMVLIATLIAFSGSEISTLLRYDRNLILTGEIWRVLSGHLVHLNTRHLAMNVAGLVLIWVLVGSQLSASAWAVLILCNALIISLGLLLLNPELTWYVGLSGILHGMLVGGCFSGIWYSPDDRKLLILILVLISVKLFWEQVTGPLPGSEGTAGGRVIVDAHLYGGICGLLWGVIQRIGPAIFKHAE